MKRFLTLLLLAALLLATPAIPAMAEEFSGSDNWSVSFDGSKMDSNFTSGDIADKILQLEPGDTVNFSIALENKYEDATDWYMANEVLQTLEDSNAAAEGGAYTYILTYVRDGETKTLYSSEQVGGEAGAGTDKEGLHEATDSLKDYFYLDTLEKNAGAAVELTVLLDGESQGNSYMDSAAKLQMNFAVEKHTDDPDKEKPYYPAKTGDAAHIVLWFSLMFVSLAVIILLLVPKRKKKEGRRR